MIYSERLAGAVSISGARPVSWITEAPPVSFSQVSQPRPIIANSTAHDPAQQ